MEESIIKQIEVVLQEIRFMHDEIKRSYDALLKVTSIIIPVIVTAYAGAIVSKGHTDIHFSIPIAASFLLTFGILMGNHIWVGLHAFYWRKSCLLKRAERLIGNEASFGEFFITKVPINVNKPQLGFMMLFYLMIFGILFYHSCNLDEHEVVSAVSVGLAFLFSAISISITNNQNKKLLCEIDQL